MSDISRVTFDPKKHYVGVVMQQGRVQLDADWNEQQAIYQHRTETEARDVIGQCGVPQLRGGFRIGFTPDNTDLTISPGRMYVDGILCELNEATPVPVRFLDENHVQVQSWNVDGQDFQKGQWVEFLDAQMQFRKLTRILDIDATQQSLTLLTDKTNYDTTGLKDEKDLYLRRVTTYTTQPYCPTTEHEYPGPAYATYPDDTKLPTLNLHANHYLLVIYIDAWKRSVTSLDDEHMLEAALGGIDTAARLQTVWQVKILPIELQAEFRGTLAKRQDLLQQLSEIQSGGQGRSKRREIEDSREQLEQEIATYSSTLTCNSSFSEWDALTASPPGMMNARTFTGGEAGNPGYQRLENQLYRVEVHRGSDDQEGPYYKWSRDNGSVVALIESVVDNKVVVKGIGLDDDRGFSAGQWVELLNDERELNGLPGHFVRIKEVDPITKALQLEQGPPQIDGEQHTKIRRWDGGGAIAMNGTWLNIESGIQVQFSPGVYKNGDYWLIPARTQTGDIEWPPFAVPNVNPIPQERAGVYHHYARLARVLLAQNVQVQDCRRRFGPLATQAMRVLGINWVNDAEHPRAILRDGLHITLDGEPDPLSVNSASMILTVEPTLPGDGESIFIMSGHIEVKANNIYWRWGYAEEGGLAELFDKLDIFFRGPRHRPRVRVTLRGHQIWCYTGNQILYLDGQTFGMKGVQSDGTTPRHSLMFPSGVSARASDFESWFYLVQ